MGAAGVRIGISTIATRVGFNITALAQLSVKEKGNVRLPMYPVENKTVHHHF